VLHREGRTGQALGYFWRDLLPKCIRMQIAGAYLQLDLNQSAGGVLVLQGPIDRFGGPAVARSP